MSSSLKIVDLRPAVSEDAVELLEWMLDLARAGTVTEVAIIAHGADGSVYCNYTKTDDQWRRMGEIERMKHRLMMQADGAS